MTVLISVWGASPGVGKSTLCDGLSRWLAGAGLRGDHFREEEVLTRPQFTAVAEEFKATGRVRLQTLIAGTAQFVDAVVASGDDVVITDALVPFVPTLLAMGHGEEAIDAFMSDLTEVLAQVRPVIGIPPWIPPPSGGGGNGFLRSRAGKAGSPPGRIGVYRQRPAGDG
ncbi:hypothetical protein SRB17_86270 [Streptomyces sp. RB17]|uniref:hypothetical protein n=1 Tax=Streptomyces sp. RB17 TaxID=2585197 RepID=UPI00130840DE|nr:hypothetical protein [Streptomyces sp. RB17]MQY40594.1 hypothetical protein [Streptomyces sp. RB17]